MTGSLRQFRSAAIGIGRSGGEPLPPGAARVLPWVLGLCGTSAVVAAVWIWLVDTSGAPFSCWIAAVLGASAIAQLMTGAAIVVMGRRLRSRRADSERATTRLRIATEGAGIGFWDRDLITGDLDWDDAMFRIYGVERSGAVPTSDLWASLVHPEDLDATTDLFDRTISGLDTFDTSFRIVTPAGEVRTVRTAATVIHDEDGRAVRVVGANWDVTELERATRELSATATRLSLAVRAARIGLWEVDLKTRESQCDDTFHVLIGYEPGELNRPGLDWHSLCHPDDLDAMRSECQAYLYGLSDGYRREYRKRAKSGDWLWVHDAGEVVERDAWGVPTRMVGVRMLIDESKRTNDLLKSIVSLEYGDDERGMLTRIARSVADALDVMCVTVARFRTEDGEPVAEVVGAWHRDRPMEPMTYPLRGTPCGTAVDGGFCLHREGVQAEFPEDNDLRTLGAESYAGVQILNSRGEAIGVLNIMHDSALRETIDFESILRVVATRAAVEIERGEYESRLRDSKSEAERANAVKSQFLANISHELRTPIQAMIGFSDLLVESRAVELPTVHDFASTISRNGAHLLAIVNDLLDTAKIESGQMKVEQIECNLAEVLGDVERLLGPKIREKHLAFSIVCETPLPAVVRTDPVRVRQIIMNLVGNAAKFTDEGGVGISVSYDAGSDTVSFRVDDTGVGIDAGTLSSLFTPFVQAEASTMRRFGGTGLGLSISRNLARMMGGDIVLASEPGEGTSCRFTIAANAGASSEMISERAFIRRTYDKPVIRDVVGPARPELQGLRILLIEDGPDNRRLLKFHLERVGATVVLAGDGAEGLEIAGKHSAFDVIFTDLQMPVLDGYEFTRKYRERGGSTPIIALTAHATADDERACLEAGCSGYRSKPVSRDQLVSACLDVLGRSARSNAA